MLRFIYSLALTIAVPLILLRLLLRSLKAPAYRQRIGERFGFFRLPAGFDTSRNTVWIHAVSVGETVAAGPLVDALLEQSPRQQIVVTTMTPTGSDRVRELFGDKVFHVYLPYDLPFAVGRFLEAIKPDLLVLMETELWPNMIHYSHRQGVKIILANARLSERSERGYRRLGKLTRDMLSQLHGIAAQSEADAKRLLALGAPDEKVEVTGSLKFNVEMNYAGEQREGIFASVVESQRKLIIAASTREGEEEKVLAAFRKVLQNHGDVLLLLVPRHPERFNAVAGLCESLGLNVQRRSSSRTLEAETQVLLGDSMGEMPDYYSLAQLAFVGGSLVDTGCQNVLEPAALGIPVLVGPSQFNFANICAQLEQSGALITVGDENELAQRLDALLLNDEQRTQMGAAGKSLVQANQQALPRLLTVLNRIMAAS